MSQPASHIAIDIKNIIIDVQQNGDIIKSYQVQEQEYDYDSEQEYEYNMYEGSDKYINTKDESKLTSYERYCRGLPVSGDIAMMKMLEEQGYRR